MINFADAYNLVCESGYGIRSSGTNPFLRGAYHLPMTDDKSKIEIIWPHETPRSKLEALVHANIIPEAVEFFAEKTEIDFRVSRDALIGHLAISSASPHLTQANILEIVQTRLELVEFEIPSQAAHDVLDAAAL